MRRKLLAGRPKNDATESMTRSTGLPQGSPDRFVVWRPLIVATLSILFFISLAGFVLSIPGALSGHVDFRTFYTAGFMVRTGHGSAIHDYQQTLRFQNELVSPAPAALPFFHLAYEALLYVPFSFLSYKKAYLAFFLCNLALVLLAIRMIGLIFPPLRQIWSWLPSALLVCFLPLTMALIEGQDSLLLLALLAAATLAMERENEVYAGVLVGLSLFKFQYGLPIAALFVLWRRWRFVSGFALAAVVIFALSVSVLGVSGVAAFAQLLPGTSVKFSAANDAMLGIHPEGMANLRGVVYMFSGGAPRLTNLITVILSCAALAWAAFWKPSIPGALLTAMLVSYHQMISDTTLLVLPIGLVISQSFEPGTERRPWPALAAIVVFVAPAILLFVGTRFYLEALPILTLFVLFPGLQRPSPKKPERSRECLQTETPQGAKSQSQN